MGPAFKETPLFELSGYNWYLPTYPPPLTARMNTPTQVSLSRRAMWLYLITATLLLAIGVEINESTPLLRLGSIRNLDSERANKLFESNPVEAKRRLGMTMPNILR